MTGAVHGLYSVAERVSPQVQELASAVGTLLKKTTKMLNNMTSKDHPTQRESEYTT